MSRVDYPSIHSYADNTQDDPHKWEIFDYEGTFLGTIRVIKGEKQWLFKATNKRNIPAPLLQALWRYYNGDGS